MFLFASIKILAVKKVKRKNQTRQKQFARVNITNLNTGFIFIHGLLIH
jgi:hypothetical protein